MTANMVTAVAGFGASPLGGYFGCAPGQTPAGMRADEGMVSLLFTPPSFFPVPPGQYFIAGVRDDAADRGWSVTASVIGPRVLVSFLAGDMAVDWDLAALATADHVHALMAWDAGNLSVFINGVLVGQENGIYVAELTREFSIGNSTEDLTESARDAAVSALAFGPLPPVASVDDVSTFLLSQWREVERAGDILDLLDLYTNVWSCRRSLTNVVNGGNETWVDWKAGVVLNRLGTKAGTAVSARPAEWAKTAQLT